VTAKQRSKKTAATPTGSAPGPQRTEGGRGSAPPDDEQLDAVVDELVRLLVDKISGALVGDEDFRQALLEKVASGSTPAQGEAGSAIVVAKEEVDEMRTTIQYVTGLTSADRAAAKRLLIDLDDHASRLDGWTGMQATEIKRKHGAAMEVFRSRWEQELAPPSGRDIAFEGASIGRSALIAGRETALGGR
jgi:cell division septum initiation protein DivIVA